jgi:hypothetical protein
MRYHYLPSGCDLLYLRIDLTSTFTDRRSFPVVGRIFLGSPSVSMSRILHRMPLVKYYSQNSTLPMMQVAQLYFHSPCFDGIVSGVLAWDLLETQERLYIEEFHAVNYESKSEWLSTKLSPNAAVIDFLYHPDARFWADHHSTTFLTEEARRDFENRTSRWLIYDRRSGSCASLLWKHFLAAFGYRNQRYQNLVNWAERIDSARYASVEQAIFGMEPALQINLTLAGEDGPEYCTNLLKLLKSETLEYVAALPEVRERSAHAESLIREGMQRFVKGSRLEPDGIVVYVVDSTDVIISRYAPYYIFPDARYSVGLVISPDGASIKHALFWIKSFRRCAEKRQNLMIPNLNFYGCCDSCRGGRIGRPYMAAFLNTISSCSGR